MTRWRQLLTQLVPYPRWGGAILFYSRFPWPPSFPVTFDRIAAWAPVIGALMATGLMGVVATAQAVGVAATLWPGIWVFGSAWLTGGLHLDGVADCADGLAVTDSEKRLSVMKDSYTGAFGAMAITAVLGLKILSILALGDAWKLQGWSVFIAMLWGRWGQLVAIASYPYLRADGKGAVHRKTLKPLPDLLIGTISALILSGVCSYCLAISPMQLWGGISGAIAISLGVGYWWSKPFGGMTGDVYGAIVEWSEVGILVFLCSWLGQC